MKLIPHLFCAASCWLAAAALAAPKEPTLLLIAHKDVTLDKLSPERATQIFLRQQQSWPDGQAIQPIDLREGHALRRAFYEQLSGRSPGQLRAYWARQSFTGMGLPPRQVESDEEVARLVQSTPGAIGYVTRKPAGSTVKVLLSANLE
ncbi:ABC-type phosphate transport system substrate-binding protein [Paucibacter oligotrophus]|uniref:ABC-type phosphate transport system substrate-binding protein n=1 Tax=Roseateles oligotrophus TaxID=1769250 RepID=A0A840LH31_9BURK|nr:phosphate ABC transporter substrate-binding protein [Roseateles oligotrophus]MBB4845913.1 ABC-type phosphate transport system substrate-binding protein [Roseateles oligotrophus]